MQELEGYRRKRRRSRTPEPFDETVDAPSGPRFVVQRHSARRLHYDLRLERDGVLASWAVPKGLPTRPRSRRMAVHTEDHPLAYLDFEGEIPAGEYGAGVVDVYDTGTYELLSEKRDGALTFRLAGERLRGEWSLVPARLDGDERNWLLVRRADGAESRPRRRYLPMLATPVDDVPRRGEWIYEVKWDGYRAMARLDGGEPALWSRRGQDLTERFSAVASALGRGLRTFDCVVDGEVCALDERGRPSFQLLQRTRGKLIYFVFDLLELEGEQLLRRPLRARRALLEELVDERHGTVRLSATFDEGDGLLEVAREQGLEGVVAKRTRALYQPGVRSRDWLKVKTRPSEEFLIAGYVRGEGARSRLGSLVLARDDDGSLRYAGNVGTGFTEGEIDRLLARLDALRRDASPLARVPDDPRLRKRVTWVEPSLTVEVEFAEWTQDGRVRSPSYKGLRDERAADLPAEVDVRRGARVVRLTRLDALWWPDEGIRKRDVVDYYRRVGSLLLPHLRDRPFTFKRHYRGPRSPFEWIKDAPPELPEWIPVAPLPARSRGGELVRYALVNDEPALLWMLEFGCVDLHVWTSRADRPDRPDYVLFDLDAAHVPFSDVVRAAFVLHDALAALRLESFVRTTGGDGLHVLVPLERRHTHAEAREFCEVIAGALVRSTDGLVTTERALARRRGVYVDTQMNGHGQQIVSLYSVRPRPGAPVATPLRWDELHEDLDPREFTMEAVLERVEQDGDLHAPLLRRGHRLDRALERLV